jgi:hypothetical protein
MNPSWSSRIPIDHPATPIDWDWSESEFNRKYPKSDHFQGPFVSLLGIGPLTYHVCAGASSQMLRVYLHSVPQKLQTEIPLYHTASEILRAELGEPTLREQSSFPCLWPDHERLWWRGADIEVLLYIEDVFWNSMELMTIQIQRTDRSRHYSSWNPRRQQEAEQGATGNPYQPVVPSTFSVTSTSFPELDTRPRW